MALNEVALADKIAAIMSGNFLPPPVPSKGKKKSKVCNMLVCSKYIITIKLSVFHM